jgi:hypothetical protein
MIVVAGCRSTRYPTITKHPSKEDTKEEISMSTNNRPNIAEFRKLMSPVLRMQVANPETVEGRFASEGLMLPEPNVIIEQALRNEEIPFLLNDTIAWIHTVVREQWIVDDLNSRLFAVRKVTNGEDAFIGAWTSGGRNFLVVVTMERVHLLTRMAGTGNGVGSDLPSRALSLSYEILQLPEKPDRSTYLIQNFRGLVRGIRVPPQPFARQWHQTLQFLTDGFGVKYSVKKYKNRSSEPKSDQPRDEAIPWFPEPKQK